MTAYLVFICLIVSLLSLDYIQQREGYSIFTVIALFVTLLFTVFRFETGYDYLIYTSLLDDFQYTLTKGMELGFLAISWIIVTFELDSFWLFFVFGIAIILFLWRGIKLYTTNVRIAFLIFLLVPGLFLNSFSIIRQSLAMVIIFNAYFYLFEKRYKPFILLCILATLFHYSVLFALPFFWLATKLKSKALLVLFIGVPLSLILAKMNIVGIIIGVILGSSKFATYIGYEDAGTNILKLIVLNISIIPYIVFYKHIDNRNRSLIVLVVFGLMFTNIFANIAAITRMGYYFKIFEIVLLANIVSNFKKGTSQAIFCILLFIYFFAMFYSSLSYDYKEVTDYPKMTPYKTIFEQ